VAGAAPARSAALETAVAPVAAGAGGAAAAGELPRLAASPLPQPVAPKLELVRMVEPELPPRLLELLARPEVAVEFLIRPDGTVTNVRVLPPVPRQAVPMIVAAVEQWRFAPLLVAREHRVQLVFTNR
jgi:TonB family protein